MSNAGRLTSAMIEMLKRMELTGSWFNGRATDGRNGWRQDTFNALCRRSLVDGRSEKMTDAGRAELIKRGLAK